MSNSKNQKSLKLNSLLAAALALPGLGLAKLADAQTPPEAATVRVRYSGYREYQGGKENRMSVLAPMMSLETPLGEKDQLDFSLVYDSMTGASPYYHNSLSGASGTEIRDTRRAGDLKFTHYFEQFSIGVGGRLSDEDDYYSKGGLIDSKIWTPDKNTTFSLGFSYDKDDISSSQSEDFGDRRRTQGYMFGITQVLNQKSVWQNNLSYTASRGYHSDAYKPFDSRPKSREAWSWLSRYVYYVEDYDASIHTDYRFFIDTWGVKSHTLEVAWYQPIGTAWMLRPSVRYYTQSSADFYDRIYPPEDFETFYSADERMGNYGSLGAAIKLARELGQGFSADISIEGFLQRPELKLGGDSSDLKDFYVGFFSVGVSKKF